MKFYDCNLNEISKSKFYKLRAALKQHPRYSVIECRGDGYRQLMHKVECVKNS